MNMVFGHKGMKQSTPNKCEESTIYKMKLAKKGKKGPAPKKQKSIEWRDWVKRRHNKTPVEK